LSQKETEDLEERKKQGNEVLEERRSKKRNKAIKQKRMIMKIN
jgi:hypothetical protein